MDSSRMGYENRRFTRVPVTRPAQCVAPVEQTLPTQTVDVSASGVGLVGDTDAFPLGTQCTVTIRVEDDKVIEATGTIVYREDGRLGIEMSGIKEDSLPALRDLIVDHADNAEKADQEIIDNMEFLPMTY